MTIEITSPETQTLIQRCLESGEFQDIDELLTQALGALQEKKQPATEPLSNAERRKREGRKSLVELFAESPLKGLDLDFSRNKSTGRPVDL